MSEPRDVFISYHTDSAGDQVRKIASALEGAGISCWYAPRDCGANYAGSIVEAIRACGREGRVRVLTHDNSPENRALLQAGTVDFVIGQNLAYQSYKALAVLFDAAAERKLPERSCFYPETPIFNAENC